MASLDIERLHYYQRQFLGAADFEAEQTYLRDMRRRHNIGQHTQGIVVGLELVEQPSPGVGGGVDVFIQPGMAVDGYGREIFVLAPTQLDPVLFDSFLSKQHQAVYIEYLQESAQQPQAGYESCETADQYARLVETFQIVVSPKPPLHDPVTVGGKALKPAPFPPPSPPPANPDLTIPADESVPYQELPDDQDAPRWLLRLGSAFWDGPNKQFITTTADHYFEGRIYVGAIADRIFAPAAKLTISPRTIPSDASASDLSKIDMDAADFAEVRGRLQVDGAVNAIKDVNIHGGKLSFLNAGGLDEGVPLWMKRMPPPAGAGVDLRIHIGDTAEAKDRLTIGPSAGSSEQAVLAVRADDRVKIETGSLDFGKVPRQSIHLSSSDDTTHEYGLGVQTGAVFFRSDREFYWYKGGDFNAAAGNAGSGGAVQLRLDEQARLFGSTTRQMLNLWADLFAIGIQDWTMYFRTDGDFCWYRHGVHDGARSSPGAGGTLAMKLDDANRLSLKGDFSNTGNVLIGDNGDGVLTVRNIHGKSQFSNAVSDLFLNFQTGTDVFVGNMGGASSSLHVSGDLRVRGQSNLIHVAQKTFAQRNDTNADTPRAWHWNYSGENFSEVYAVYAVFQGFSIFDNQDNLGFTNIGHVKGDKFVPQHAFVRVTTSPLNNSFVDGVSFCSESDPAAPQSDNTVLFTVIAIGRTAA